MSTFEKISKNRDHVDSSELPITMASGPSKIPTVVKEQIVSEFFSYKGTNLSIVETFHRSEAFEELMKSCQNNLRDLLQVPSNYRILLLQGGGSGQFAAVPMNLLGGSKKSADYLVTCTWSEKAFKEAKKYGHINSVYPRAPGYSGPPKWEECVLNPEAAYFYYCDNDTVEGFEFSEPPKVPEGVPIVCDMSSNLLTKPIDVTKYGIIFAGAQKNLGCAGCTVVIVREDLMDQAMDCCPNILNYRLQANANSIYNTPPVFGVYVCNLMLEWARSEGGVPEMDKRCRQRSSHIYDIIDNSKGFYRAHVKNPTHRSRVNVIMRLRSPELEDLWHVESTAAGLLHTKGHRSFGGIRITMYNSFTENDLKRLSDFMHEFQKRYQSEA